MTSASCINQCRTEGSSTRRLEIDGEPVGPVFHSSVDPIGEVEELADAWMAKNRPTLGYSIVSARLGRCFRRVSHPAEVAVKQLDYSPW